MQISRCVCSLQYYSELAHDQCSFCMDHLWPLGFYHKDVNFDNEINQGDSPGHTHLRDIHEAKSLVNEAVTNIQYEHGYVKLNAVFFVLEDVSGSLSILHRWRLLTHDQWVILLLHLHLLFIWASSAFPLLIHRYSAI